MRLINVTSNHPTLVKNQLRNTDATFVEVYSAGNTDVIFTQAPKHYELVISNKYRAIKDSELEKIREFFLHRKVDTSITQKDKIKTSLTDKLIIISIPTTD